MANTKSLRDLIVRLQNSPGEFTPEDQKIVDELEARIAGAPASDIPQYKPRVQPPGPMPAHSASPPNPHNPAFRPLETAEIPDAVNPAVAPNPVLAMSKVAGPTNDLEVSSTGATPTPVSEIEPPARTRKSTKKARIVKLKVKAKARAKSHRRAA